MLKNKSLILRRVGNAVLIGAGAFVLLAVAAMAHFAWRSYRTVCDVRASFDFATQEVIIHRVYRDGHTEVIERFTESSTQGMNPLQDPMYAGQAPIATSYDPLGMYASDAKFGSFEYNQGIRCNDDGKFSRDDKTGIMTVEFHNGTTSWVDSSGVIASAKVEFGYDFDDYEVYVAFYER